MSAPSRQADCHPDRKHCSRGLCRPCYDFNKDRGWPNGKPALQPVLSIRPACHPDRPHHGKGLCVTCFEERRVARSLVPRGARWRSTAKLRPYGLTATQYEALAEKQDRVCAICRDAGLLCVDHDHATGVVRGLLCGNCNRAIGQLKDSPDRARAAARYLESAACYVKRTG